MKKQLPMTAAMAAAIAALPACSPRDDWGEPMVADRDTAICVNEAGERVDDDLCANGRTGGARFYGNSNSGFLWYYLGRRSAIPYYGDSIHDRRRAVAGSFVPMAGTRYAEAPVETRITRSQAIRRGGLGLSSRRFGSGRG
ncbi:hypothetical protein GVO57_13845 [Sphingomonas changnyeongensis]|uniref:Uncharacterized protein n=1 Tax=Sphingomonas changnyeongensis TaxID=2698679 RepID=A0A7Z2S609_9SPHN|nr:hypothetical protein [Sphingomonas changnyeongensis]QHL91680.1 hypothetical protein GVO57_13845 [Sphingomonas changnyeongensis]